MYTEVRNMKNYRIDIFRTLVSTDPRWLQYWESNSVTEMWDIMYNIILDSTILGIK